jgi:hypothetical protein
LTSNKNARESLFYFDKRAFPFFISKKSDKISRILVKDLVESGILAKKIWWKVAFYQKKLVETYFEPKK